MWENGEIEEAEDFAKKEIFDRPKYFLNLDKIRKIFNVDRRISVKEFLQVAFGDKESFEMKDDLLESAWEKFMEINPVDQAHYQNVKNFFKAYTTDKEIREIIDAPNGELWGKLNTTPAFTFEEFNACNGFRQTVPQYVRDYAYHLTNL